MYLRLRAILFTMSCRLDWSEISYLLVLDKEIKLPYSVNRVFGCCKREATFAVLCVG